MTEKVSTCGQCVHARPHPNGDLRMRSCHGGPPQLVPVISPKGMTVSQFWPHVMITDQVCGVFKQKIEPLLRQ